MGTTNRPTIINIKPLSVNRCWQGKRFKTPTYKAYEKQVSELLPDNVVVPKGKLTLYIRWGFSSKLSDWDNPVKPFQDILQKEYEFDDRYIYLAIVEKIDVKKGDEFIEFKIKSHNEEDVMILLTKMEARLIEEVLEDIELMIDNGEDWIDEMSERVKDAKEIIHACNVYQETRPLFEEGETSE